MTIYCILCSVSVCGAEMSFQFSQLELIEIVVILGAR